MKPLVLLLSGPVGVGKTTVAGELGDVLEARQIPNTVVDFDALCWTYPRNADDPWNNQLGLDNLAALWGNAYRRGSRNLVIATVVETTAFVEAVAQRLGDVEVMTCQLDASLGELEQRVRAREIGNGLDWHLARSKELAAQLATPPTPADLRVTTNQRSVAGIASEIADRIDWCGAFDDGPWLSGDGMLHHLSLPASDLDKSRAFYDAALGALGYRCVYADGRVIGYGVEDDRDKLSLKRSPSAAIEVGFHLAFRAPSHAAVDDFHAAALQHGGQDNGTPGLREAYGPNYYAAFVIDPDGHQLEAVCKEATAKPFA